MIQVAGEQQDYFLESKLLEIKGFTDESKKNRWFGYFQKEGEDRQFWSLNLIEIMIRNEIKN